MEAKEKEKFMIESILAKPIKVSFLLEHLLSSLRPSRVAASRFAYENEGALEKNRTVGVLE